MAMIAIPLAQDTSRLFREIEVDGARDPSDHISLFYLGDSLDIKKLLKMIPVVYEIVSNYSPIEITCSKITKFPKGEYGYPVIAEVKSPKLMELRESLKEAFDNSKIKYDNKFPEYHPHVTLAYSKKRPKNIRLPNKAKFMANQVAIYGGDEVDSKLFINFPLSLGVQKTAQDKLLELSNVFYKSSK